MARKRGYAINGESCCDCGSPFSENERIIEIWNKTFATLTGKKHWDVRTCERILRNRKDKDKVLQ